MRARNIKPQFFINDELAELSPLCRLLFAGLWCVADREGRLEDRPKRIKSEVLPYDDCDIDDMLNQLQAHNFIARYLVDGVGYIQILTFVKHQNPHKNEKGSDIPPYSQADSEGNQEKHGTSTVQAQCKDETTPENNGSAPADSLIPDSPIPDSPIPDSGKKPSCQMVADDYNATCKSLPAIKVLTDKRKNAIKDLQKKGLDLHELFTKAEASDFLSGRNGVWTNCNFDWLIDANNAVKVLEGVYINKPTAEKGKRSNKAASPKRSYELNDFERKAMQAKLRQLDQMKGAGESG